MPIPRSQHKTSRAISGTACLASLFLAAVAFGSAGCASAKVGAPADQPDGGNTDATSNKKDGAGGDDNSKKDGSADLPPAVCDFVTNSGCDSDKKCTALQTGLVLALGCGTRSVKEGASPGAEGDTCTVAVANGAQSGDDCGEGLACFTSDYKCHRLCIVNGPACPSLEACNVLITGLTFCSSVTPCKPLAQDCTDGSQACYASTVGAICLAKGSKSPGSSCTNPNECEKGSTCIIEKNGGVCESFCSKASDGSPKCAGAATGGDDCSALPVDVPADPNAGSCRPKA